MHSHRTNFETNGFVSSVLAILVLAVSVFSGSTSSKKPKVIVICIFTLCLHIFVITVILPTMNFASKPCHWTPGFSFFFTSYSSCPTFVIFATLSLKKQFQIQSRTREHDNVVSFLSFYIIMTVLSMGFVNLYFGELSLRHLIYDSTLGALEYIALISVLQRLKLLEPTIVQNGEEQPANNQLYEEDLAQAIRESLLFEEKLKAQKVAEQNAMNCALRESLAQASEQQGMEEFESRAIRESLLAEEKFQDQKVADKIAMNCALIKSLVQQEETFEQQRMESTIKVSQSEEHQRETFSANFVGSQTEQELELHRRDLIDTLNQQLEDRERIIADQQQQIAVLMEQISRTEAHTQHVNQATNFIHTAANIRSSEIQSTASRVLRDLQTNGTGISQLHQRDAQVALFNWINLRQSSSEQSFS